MGVREPYMVKTVLGNNALTLEAKADESILVKNIQIYSPTAEKYLTISTDKTTVGFFRTSGVLGGHLSLPYLPLRHSHDFKASDTMITTPVNPELYDAHGGAPGSAALVTETGIADNTILKSLPQFASIGTPQKTLLKYLFEREIFKGYPIQEGQIMTLSGVAEANAIQIVTYEVGDAGDYQKNQENGSEAAEYFFVNYGRVTGNLTTAGSTIYDVLQSPAEFPDFPYNQVVPAKVEIDVLGVLASCVLDWDAATDFTYTQYLKFIKDRITLFDDDKNGLLIQGGGIADAAATLVGEGYSLIGNYSNIDTRKPFMFPNPLLFGSGDELGIYMTVAASTSAGIITPTYAEIGLIEKVKVIG